MTRRERLKELQQIPGAGPAIAKDLYSFGVTSVRRLNERSPATDRVWAAASS